jgi:hypothetical protein
LLGKILFAAPAGFSFCVPRLPARHPQKKKKSSPGAVNDNNLILTK